MLREAYDQASNYLTLPRATDLCPQKCKTFFSVGFVLFHNFSCFFFHLNFFIPQILNVVFLIFFLICS